MTIEVKEVLLPWHHRLDVHSGSMWMLQERVIGREIHLGTSDRQHRMRFRISTPIFLEPEERTNKKDRLVTIQLTPTIKQPAAGGNPGGNSAGLLNDCAGSGDENDDEDESEDEDDPPVEIDKSK